MLDDRIHTFFAYRTAPAGTLGDILAMSARTPTVSMLASFTLTLCFAIGARTVGAQVRHPSAGMLEISGVNSARHLPPPPNLVYAFDSIDGVGA